MPELLVGMPDKIGSTALHCAISEGHEAAARMIIKAGGKQLLLQTDDSGASALHVAADRGYTGIAKELVGMGGKELVLLVMKVGLSPLFLAAQEATVGLLTEAGGEELLLLTEVFGNSALHDATVNDRG